VESRLRKRDDGLELVVTTDDPFLIDDRVRLDEVTVDEDRCSPSSSSISWIDR